MNNIRNSVVGIDVRIQNIQTDIYSALADIWSGDIEGFGRAYKNSIDNEFKAEWYNSSKGDYEDVYYNDSKSCVFCFLVGDDDTTEDELVFISKVKCVFMVDLSKIYTNNTKRNDAEAQRDVIEVLRNNDYNSFNITQIQRGVNNVFSGYNTNRIKEIDMQPYHCFSVNIDLQYYLTDKCS